MEFPSFCRSLIKRIPEHLNAMRAFERRSTPSTAAVPMIGAFARSLRARPNSRGNFKIP